jgi:NAD(P)-dependent dehydrogenase (short-subunit alcohol dehydrogenase family)
MRLDGKVAVITGATSGFGEAIARLFAAEGATLVLHGRRREAGKTLTNELCAHGADARFIAGDVGEALDAQALAEAAREAHGRIDVLVLNAGVATPGLGPFWEVPPEEFDLVFRTNVRGVWLCARACAPLIPAGGSIVVMASMSSFVVYPGETIYSATKGAVLQLARGMAGDLADRNVRVNALCPGICDTPLTRWFIDTSEDPAATEAEFEAAAPLGRMGAAEEIAHAALFYASDDSSYCTGSSLIADGGLTVR